MSRSEAGRLGWAKVQSKLLDRTRERQDKARAKAQGRACGNCGQPLTYEQRYHKFCSRSCAAVHNNIGVSRHQPDLKPVPQVPCPGCGTAFRKAGGKVYCSQTCSAAAKSAESIQLWLDGKIPGGSWRGVSTFVRKWLACTKGETCSNCSWAERNPKSGRIPLHVDHIDGNPENHRPENLRFLCPNCHSLTSTFGGLNRGRGRKQRYAGIAQR